MSKMKLGGSSDENAVTFFCKRYDVGIKAERKKDGSISISEVSMTEYYNNMILAIKILLGTGVFKELVILLNFPNALYYAICVFWIIIAIFGVVVMKNKETCMYHGAEHKVANWHDKDFKKDITKCSRIHRRCGTNIIATITTFQIVGAIALWVYNIHIPEILISGLPFLVSSIFPFNIFGLCIQLLTTKEPRNEHLEVAMKAYAVLMLRIKEEEMSTENLS